ncbi:complement C1s subcomponent-like [Liolophura sinensis]|uniref:complement C1s subcomponent-like n=1 Tax=Liolophura sinensis TaxID=3198878 RepID=UPI00315922B2
MSLNWSFPSLGSNESILANSFPTGSAHRNESAISLDVEDVIFRPNTADDIALVKLGRPVILNPKIRTVCLPDHGSLERVPSSLSSRWGWSVGSVTLNSISCEKWAGKTKEVKKLQYFQGMMYRLHRTVCQKRSKQTFSDLRSFCAIQRTGRDCVRDKGFPFMMQDKYRLSPVIQTGVLSSSTCCQFIVYTRVDRHVDWIRQTIRFHKEEDERRFKGIVH